MILSLFIMVLVLDRSNLSHFSPGGGSGTGCLYLMLYVTLTDNTNYNLDIFPVLSMILKSTTQLIYNCIHVITSIVVRTRISYSNIIHYSYKLVE